MLTTVEVIAVTLLAAAIVACANYLLKKSIRKFKFNFKGLLSMISNRNVIAGILVYAIGFVFYLVALDSGQLSFVYPAFSSTFIFIILISHFMLGEEIGHVKIAGIALILIGIALVSGII